MSMATRKPRPAHPFAGARRMKPTKRHRPAIWEGILGTVYALSPSGEERYFDYDWDGARAWAGVTGTGLDPADLDLRVYRAGPGRGLRPGQPVLWIRRR